jgi:hypothetical protein
MAGPGNLRGVARPTRKLRARLEMIHGRGFVERMDRVMEDEAAIDAFSRLLTEAVEKNTSKDGRVDMKDVAAFVLAEMKRHPR